MVAFALAGCNTAPSSPNQVSFVKEVTPIKESTLTFGLVQQIVKKGSTEQQIIEGLGSPNMVTNNSSGETSWIYDAVSTTIESSNNSSSASILGGVGNSNAILGGGVGKAEASSKVLRTQRTLTVIIKIKDGIVVSYATRATKF